MNPQRRINGFHTWALIMSAVSVDFFQSLLTFIPLVGPFFASMLAILARIVFWIWFKMLRVGFADKSHRYIANVTITLVEMLPLINFIPGWTIGTIVIINQVKAEDKKFNEEQAKQM